MRTMSSIWFLSSLASRSAFSTGSNVPLKRSVFSSSNFVLVIVAFRLSPSARHSNSILVSVSIERTCLAF